MGLLKYVLGCFIISIIITIIFEVTKKFRIYISKKEGPKQSTLGIIIAFASIIYTLLITFMISIFIQRYYTLKELFIGEVSLVQLIYETTKDLPGSDFIIEDIREYIKEYENVTIPALKRGDKKLDSSAYKKLRSDVLSFARKNKDPMLNGILQNKLQSDINIKGNLDEKLDSAMVIIIFIMTIFILVSLWFVEIGHSKIQIMMDFCIIVIMVFMLSIVYYLSTPFKESPLSIDLDIFDVLKNEVMKSTST